MAPKPGSLKTRDQYRLWLDPEMVKQFLAAVAMGMSESKACDLCGIDQGYISQIITQAENYASQGHWEPHSKEWQYVNFFKKVKKARAGHEAAHLTIINNAAVAGIKNWTASAWMLERKHPAEYSNRYQIAKQAETMVKEYLKFVFQQVSLEARAELAEALQHVPGFNFEE